MQPIDNLHLFTFLIVNLKPEGVEVWLPRIIKFTFLIVNLKHTNNNVQTYTVQSFTFLIVNLKHYVRT